MSHMMKAAVIAAPKTVSVGSYSSPTPGPGEVLVRLEGCGVCASNLPVWEGRPWFTYPVTPGNPGHEGWGRVETVGGEVKSLSPGDRVAVLSTKAFAEYDVAPEETVVKLPEGLGSIPFPGEPVGCAINAFGRCDISAGQTVAIIGIGFLGAIITALAGAAGARVIAISRRPFSLEMARHYGAAETILLDDHYRIIGQVKALTGGQGCDRVVEATGYQWPLDLAGELTRERGKLIIAGYHQDGPRQVNMQLWNWRGLDVINAHERDHSIYAEGIRRGAEVVASGNLDLAPLLTHTFELDRLGEAFTTLSNRPEGFMKALVTL